MLFSFLYHSLLKSAVGSVEKQRYIRLLLVITIKRTLTTSCKSAEPL